MHLNETIYINGEKRCCTPIDAPVFYADLPSLPGRPCSAHRLTEEAVRHLQQGGAVRTSGNHYSLQPPRN